MYGNWVFFLAGGQGLGVQGQTEASPKRFTQASKW